MYQGNDVKRFERNAKYDEVERLKAANPELTDWVIDITRLLHSPSFRRLSGKTQLYPNIESDYFRNRLTHSMEVAQIAKSITNKINLEEILKENGFTIEQNIVEFAALAHDLGHPPFGHIGEEALDECMKGFGGFEGNAQTFRLLTKIEKKIFANDPFLYPSGVSTEGKDFRRGLNLTYRSLASILKYTFRLGSREVHKGYFAFDQDLIDEIIRNIIPKNKQKYFENLKIDFKTVECTIMDIADDIAYATYDFEDSIKAEFITPLDLLFPEEIILKAVTKKINGKEKFLDITEHRVKNELKNIFDTFKKDFVPYREGLFEGETKEAILKEDIESMHKQMRKICKNSHFRSELTCALVENFIKGTRISFNKEIPAISTVYLEQQVELQVEVLKQFVYVMLTSSPRLKIVDYRGREIVTKIFQTISGSMNTNGINSLSNEPQIKRNGHELLPQDHREIYDIYNNIYIRYLAEERVLSDGSDIEKLIEVETKRKEVDAIRHRVICDFIASMTNRYAIEFYGRVTSEHPATIFKGY